MSGTENDVYQDTDWSQWEDDELAYLLAADQGDIDAYNEARSRWVRLTEHQMCYSPLRHVFGAEA